jgi:D-3-phosphoglycerate dehydrogenase / 2-oxoglutarate reductase
VSWNVLITAPALAETGGAALELLRRTYCEVTNPLLQKPLTADPLRKILSNHDAVLAGVEGFYDDVLESEAASRLKIISRWGVGLDSIDVAVATRLGIVVCNTRGLLDEAVADYTFALLLGLSRQIPKSHAALQSGIWKQVWGCDVNGRTLGIIGFGGVGRAVARRAAGFDLRVLVHDPAPGSRSSANVEFVPLDQLLAVSDFVSLHASLTGETYGMIGVAQLKAMKRSALLINTARGALVNEIALDRALRENWIGGAALDVFCSEPPPGDHPLRNAPNVILTPHQASFARQTGERVSLAAAQAIVDLMQGKRPQCVVNPEVFNSPNLRAPVHA